MNNYNEKFEVFYDGACSLCKAEMNLLRRLDRRERIIMTDIAAESFDSQGETGRSYDVLMRSIHGRFADGRIVHGAEVFRQYLPRLPDLRSNMGRAACYESSRCFRVLEALVVHRREGKCSPSPLLSWKGQHPVPHSNLARTDYGAQHGE